MIYNEAGDGGADAVRSTGETKLGYVPVPPIEEIAEQDEFTPEWITADDFENVWRPAVRED
ncbi:hypothetical protein GCM10010116_11720 [Microbispora rosea subsp. aerata]|nr:hypothetical protein [Microbispora rosea]GGO05965.1 hypothetical protein GCM10010116_11720 [Microbispora rosea subsp. aerata]GIH55219.1 hypothetical protein Mro02_21330 [Microbispora rosea subsp. aerata]GLJ82669.1 hypothetical protein GCM10017588_13940 [Microbispora rosea subsp. aerata]